MSASIHCRPWNSAIGRPNCLRSFTKAMRLLERALREPERDRAGADPLAVIGVDQVGKAAPQPARRQHQHILGDFQVLEDDLRFGDAAQTHGRARACR